MLKHRATFTALVIALCAAMSIGTAAPPAERKATFLEQLKPGQAVSLTEKDGRYEIGVFPPAYQPLGHKVVEVGQDDVDALRPCGDHRHDCPGLFDQGDKSPSGWRQVEDG